MAVYLLDAPDKGIGTASISGMLFEHYRENMQTRTVSNAPVYLADAKDGCYIAAGLTDNAGEFCFSHLVTGAYSLKVEYRGSVWCDEKTWLKVEQEGLHMMISVTLDGSSISTVIDKQRPATYLNPLDSGISFDPNPSPDGKLTLSMKESFQRLRLEISDLSGWIVRTMDLNEIRAGYSDTLNLDDLEKGTYILEITTNRDRLSKQLVLQ
jgi:hypothetical protein